MNGIKSPFVWQNAREEIEDILKHGLRLAIFCDTTCFFYGNHFLIALDVYYRWDENNL